MNKIRKSLKVIEESYWDCSVCTYKNNPEAFKCLMCDVRKGTSTRKPKINPQSAVHHAAQNYNNIPVKFNKRDEEVKDKVESKPDKKKYWNPKKLKNLDRSSAQAREITINNLTILVTEYKLRDNRKIYSESLDSYSSTSDVSSYSENSKYDRGSNFSNSSFNHRSIQF